MGGGNTFSQKNGANLKCSRSCGTSKLSPCVSGFVVGPLPRVRPRNGILALLLVLVLVLVPLRSEFIGEL